MKFGFRMPSLKRRIAARTSWKRIVRHSMGLKMPKGYGFLTSPKKAIYNKIYRKTTFGIEDISRLGKNKQNNTSATTFPSEQNQSQNYLPVSNTNPFTINPISFIQLINLPDKFGKDNWAITMVVIGILFIFGNPILGIILLAGGFYWLSKIKKEPWYIVKTSLQKAKRLLKANRFGQAIQPLSEALSADSANTKLNYLYGVALNGVGEYENSIEPLKIYVNENEIDLDAKLVLAYSCYKAKKFNEAIPFLQQFPQDHPSYLLVILLLGDCFMAIKDFDMAIEVFKRGPLRKTNLDNYLLQLHYLLGYAYKQKGFKKDAIKELKRVSAFDMNYKDVQKELKELEAK